MPVHAIGAATKFVCMQVVICKYMFIVLFLDDHGEGAHVNTLHDMLFMPAHAVR